MADAPFESIAQYYHIYTPILWFVYFGIVWRVATSVRHSHFFGLVTLNGLSDLLLCLLGNFFYRWPRTASFRESLYKDMQEYSFKLSFFYFLVHHLHYAEFILMLFMSFNIFCTLVIPKYYGFFWRHSFYKYIILFILLPIGLFFNLLVCQARFRQIPVNPNYFYYYLLPSSYIPQYVSHETGAALLTLILAASFFFFIICFAELLMHLCQRFDNKLERYQIEDLLIGLCYSALRTVFLVYEHLRNSYQASGDQIGLFWIGNAFPVMSDFLSLTPPLFLLLVSSQIRQLMFPCFGPQKKNRVHFDERANEVRNASEHGSEVAIEDPEHQNNVAQSIQSTNSQNEERNEQNEGNDGSDPVTGHSLAQEHNETGVQKIVGHSFESDRQGIPAENKQVSISVEKPEESGDEEPNSRPTTSSRQNLTVPPKRISTPTINEAQHQN